jgi:hypothetical protein
MKKPSSERSTQQEESRPRTGTDFVVESMRHRGIPLTRENYLRIAYPSGLPKEWTAEHEARLPEEIRKW